MAQKLIPGPIEIKKSAVKVTKMQAFRFDSSSSIRITCEVEICKGDCMPVGFTKIVGKTIFLVNNNLISYRPIEYIFLKLYQNEKIKGLLYSTFTLTFFYFSPTFLPYSLLKKWVRNKKVKIMDFQVECATNEGQKQSWGRKKREVDNGVDEFETGRYIVPRYSKSMTSIVIIDPLQQVETFRKHCANLMTLRSQSRSVWLGRQRLILSKRKPRRKLRLR